MIQIKKTILTLALLLTAATGAWAQSAVASIGSENYTTLQAAFTAAETGQTIKLLSDVTQVGGVGKSDGKAVTFDLNGHIYTCTDDYSVMATYNSQITIIDSSTGTPGGIKSELALVGQGNGKIIIKAGRYNIGDLTAEELLEYFPNWCVEMYSGYTLQDITPADAQGFCVGVVAPASSAFDVDWNKAENTGTFTMPGGNVTLEPEYYPQAALTAAPTAINDVPATTDGAIVKAGTVATIGSSETAQGTVMYYVSPTALDDDALLALAADQWTADVPTAAHLAQGQAYVYYYVRGNDSDTDDENFSDGDILAANALTVTIAAEPTYAVTFAEGTPETDKWKAEPNADVKKGQTVNVTYTGSKKVIDVKAEKKAVEPVADIIWDGTNVTDLDVPGTESYTKEGVTLRANAHMIQANWYNFGDPLEDGIGFNANEPGGFTFTAPTGKKFTKIEMTLTGSGDWEIAYGYGKLGTGWAFNADMVKEILTVTWTGSAASTVDLLKDTDDFSGANVKSIAFYLSK